MMRPNRFTLAVVGVTAVVAGSLATGVTVAAAGHHQGYAACATPKGVLVLPNTSGHCPRHTKAITLGATGAQGPAGPAGQPGPASLPVGYTHTTTHTPAMTLATNPTVATLALPAGSYQVSFSVGLYAGSAIWVGCTLRAGTTSFGTFDGGPASVDGNYYGTVTGTADTTLAAAGTITVSCNTGGTVGFDNTAPAIMTAIPVASIG